MSAQTIASYRDAIRLLLTWFRDVQAIPPEKLRLADIDRARVLAFLDWLQAERGNSASTRNQRLAAIRSFIRYTAIERPEFLGQATQIIAVKQKKTPAADMGHLSGNEVKALLAEPDPATRRGQRNTVLLSTLYDTAARVQEICDLNTCDVARPPDGGDVARQRFQDQAGPGDGSHSPAGGGLPSAGAHPTLASAKTQTRCSTDPSTPA